MFGYLTLWSWPCFVQFSDTPFALGTLFNDDPKKINKGVVVGLRKGGTFLLEAYTPKQLEYGSGGPPSAEFMMDLETLRQELAGLEIVHGLEVIRNVVEGVNHTGMGSVVQILAKKI